MNISLRVKNLIRRHDTHNPYEIAKQMKITVHVVPLPECTYGFYRRILRRKVIFVNDSLPTGVQKFVVAHELGHILLHPGYSYFRMENRSYYASRKKEEQADEFAKQLLRGGMPIGQY